MKLSKLSKPSSQRFSKLATKPLTTKLAMLTFAMLAAVCSLSAQAATVIVEVTNLTHGNYFTPLLITAHNSEVHLFKFGAKASNELQAMAEGGDIAPLAALATSVNATNVENPAAGPLAPATSTMTEAFDTGANTHLSITAMVLPTNDAFIGLNSWEIPSVPGVYTIELDAYDAGTEANDEIVNGGGAPNIAGIPADPGNHQGSGATGVTNTEANTSVHVHRGVLGDSNPAGGNSDLDATIHRWLNPVAHVKVTVKE